MPDTALDKLHRYTLYSKEANEMENGDILEVGSGE